MLKLDQDASKPTQNHGFQRFSANQLSQLLVVRYLISHWRTAGLGWCSSLVTSPAEGHPL